MQFVARLYWVLPGDVQAHVTIISTNSGPLHLPSLGALGGSYNLRKSLCDKKKEGVSNVHHRNSVWVHGGGPTSPKRACKCAVHPTEGLQMGIADTSSGRHNAG